MQPLSFDTPALAEAVEAMTAADIDRLPFGVIGLDRDGWVRVYNETEARLSGRKARPTKGKPFFTEVAPCMNNGYFKGRIDQALSAGTLDIEFTFVGDFNDPGRELHVRIQSANDGGIWIFHQRSSSAR